MVQRLYYGIVNFFILQTIARLDTNAESRLCFPQNFTFGVARSGDLVARAWNQTGKGERIWYRHMHSYPEQTLDHAKGDLRDEVDMVSEIGAQFYRFSISWSRLLPTGFSNEVNQAGLQYYRELLEELRRRRVDALVTIHHHDMPQSLLDLGGWTNPAVVDYFLDYARVLFEAFGDKVSTWLTFSDPLSVCLSRYGGRETPGTQPSGWESYLCGHNVLRAHGMVYRMYKRDYYPTQKGHLGIGVEATWMEPATTSYEDRVAAHLARNFYTGWFLHPIFSKSGDYPPVMRKRIDHISKQQKFPRSRLPYFTMDELDIIRGSSDFLGLSHFTTNLVSLRDKRQLSNVPSFEEDLGLAFTQKLEWPKSSSKWLKVVPWGFRRLLNWIKDTYNNPAVLVVANGVSTSPGVRDLKRVQYLESYLRNLHAAVTQDDCRVMGYTYWSLTDTFEGPARSSERFGLYEVDSTLLNPSRSARLSGYYFKELATTGCYTDTSYLIYFIEN